MSQNTLMAFAVLTVLACGGNCDDDNNQSFRSVGPLFFTGFYSGAGEDLHIREATAPESDENRFSAGQTKSVSGSNQFFATETDSASIDYVASRPGATLATTKLTITYPQAVEIVNLTRRIRVTYNGTTLTAVTEPVGE